jgi:hypothetical protein
LRGPSRRTRLHDAGNLVGQQPRRHDSSMTFQLQPLAPSSQPHELPTPVPNANAVRSLQTGDFTFNNGSGGEAIINNGKKFKDDPKGLLLKHDRKGVVSMGNSGENGITSEPDVPYARGLVCSDTVVFFVVLDSIALFRLLFFTDTYGLFYFCNCAFSTCHTAFLTALSPHYCSRPVR